MTPEFIYRASKALAVVSAAAGGFGMLLCMPFFLTTRVSVDILVGVGTIFVAGAVLFAAGLIGFSILLGQSKHTVA